MRKLDEDFGPMLFAWAVLTIATIAGFQYLAGLDMAHLVGGDTDPIYAVIGVVVIGVLAVAATAWLLWELGRAFVVPPVLARVRSYWRRKHAELLQRDRDELAAMDAAKLAADAKFARALAERRANASPNLALAARQLAPSHRGL